ncbi:hypothetical protein GQ42DRAFT_89294 [Ramicandelaber brevisporus]|nr:hypothetical protein GQ42DRAFT_89294 [Ramicandelaber brevisporus]
MALRGLLKRSWHERVQCFYCNSELVLQQSRVRLGNDCTSFHCDKCDCDNVFNSDGELVDSVPEMHDDAKPGPFRHVSSPSPASAALDSGGDNSSSVFCDICIHNHQMVNVLLAETDEDIVLSKYGSDEAFKAVLEERYPSVCGKCGPKLIEALNAADRTSMAHGFGQSLRQSLAARDEAVIVRVKSATLVRKIGWFVTTFLVICIHFVAFLSYNSLLQNPLSSLQSLISPYKITSEQAAQLLIANGIITAGLVSMYDPTWLSRAHDYRIQPVGRDRYRWFVITSGITRLMTGGSLIIAKYYSYSIDDAFSKTALIALTAFIDALLIVCGTVMMSLLRPLQYQRTFGTSLRGTPTPSPSAPILSPASVQTTSKQPLDSTSDLFDALRDQNLASVVDSGHDEIDDNIQDDGSEMDWEPINSTLPDTAQTAQAAQTTQSLQTAQTAQVGHSSSLSSFPPSRFFFDQQHAGIEDAFMSSMKVSEQNGQNSALHRLHKHKAVQWTITNVWHPSRMWLAAQIRQRSSQLQAALTFTTCLLIRLISAYISTSFRLLTIPILGAAYIRFGATIDPLRINTHQHQYVLWRLSLEIALVAILLWDGNTASLAVKQFGQQSSLLAALMSTIGRRAVALDGCVSQMSCPHTPDNADASYPIVAVYLGMISLFADVTAAFWFALKPLA